MKESIELNLTAVLIKDLNHGGFTAYLSELPEVVAEGDSEEDAVHNLKEAFSSILEFRREEAIQNLDASYTTKQLKLEVA